MRYSIDTVEAALLDALKRAAGLSNVVPTIDLYHGELDTLAQEIPTLPVRLPAIYVLYSGSTFKEIANRSFDQGMEFTIVNVSRSLRGHGELRNGIYQMIEAELDALLPNNDLGLTVQPVNPDTIIQVRVTEEFSIYALKVRVNDCMD